MAKPSSWKKGERKLIEQDEGTALITVTKASRTGEITGIIEIVGVDEEVAKKDTISFKTLP